MDSHNPKLGLKLQQLRPLIPTSIVDGEKREMNVQAARLWIIKTSLLITGLSFAFFLLAPALGYPLTFDQAIRLLEIVTPVFFAYLGSATHFLFSKDTPDVSIAFHGSAELFSILVKGPVYVFGLAMLAAMLAFGYSNRAAATAGAGMSVAVLAASISASLGLLAVTTNVMVAYLFSRGGDDVKKNPVDT